jgi:AAA+ ATPase superfamily predicted ATPase
MLENYFPQGIAKGLSFIGRNNEMDWLSKNIMSGYHTLLLAPRRYGKTSLAINTLEILNIPYTEINFQLIVSSKAVEKKIIEGIQDLLKKIIPTPEQILKKIKLFFKNSKQRWHLGIKDFAYIELMPEKLDDAPGNILTALQLLEHVYL